MHLAADIVAVRRRQAEDYRRFLETLVQLINGVAWEVRLPYVNGDLSLHLFPCRQTQRIVSIGVSIGDQLGYYT